MSKRVLIWLAAISLVLCGIAGIVDEASAQGGGVPHPALADDGKSEERVPFLGAYLLGNLNEHRANFQTLPGVPSCCPRFESGSGFAPATGVMFGVSLADRLGLALRLGYSSLSARLVHDEYTTVLLQGINTVGEFEHEVQARISMLEFGPSMTYDLSSRLRLSAGPRVGKILSNTFSEKETLLEPSSNGTFENGKRIRNDFTGVTPNAASFYFAISGGISYALPLRASGEIYLVPEVGFTYGLSRLSTGMDWYANVASGGVSIQYRFLSPPSRPLAIEVPVGLPALAEPPSEPLPKHPILTAQLRASMLDTALVERPIHELLIEDYIRTQYRPLLNFLFFDDGSAVLPSRYHRLSEEEVKSFDPSKLSDLETLPLYYEVLNILGSRMLKYPKGRITIVGCNADVGREKGNIALSGARAKAVFDYLRNTWHIDSTRMTLSARGLPEKPSSVSDSDGVQEDRRVEINANMWRLLEPVFTTDTAHIPKPATIRFRPEGAAEAGVAKWEVAVTGSYKLKDYSGRSTANVHDGPEQLSEKLDWELEKEHERTLAALDTVQATLTLTDNSGQELEAAPITLPVRHYTLEQKHREGSIDTIISRYSLILFDFDRGELSDANQRIARFVKARISDKARVSILGYTDRIGTDEYNQQLSELRARSTQKFIGLDDNAVQSSAGRVRTEVKGLGRSVLLHDNSLPEGRFYSRTVTVVVSTPTAR